MMDDVADQEHAVRNLVLSVCDLKQNGECPTERVLGQAVTVGTRMYLHGGCTSRRAFDEVYLLELEQMKWSELPASGQKPAPRYGHSLCHHNNHLFCFGGLCTSDTKGGQDDLLSGGAETGGNQRDLGLIEQGLPRGVGDTGCVYTMETQTLLWTKFTGDSSYARYCHSCSIVGGNVVIFGGLPAEASASTSNALNDVLVFSLDTKSFRSEPVTTSGQSPTPRYGHKSIGIGEELVVFGGLLEDNQLYSLNMETLAWSKLATQGTSPLPRRFHSFDLIGNRAFVFGGRTESGLTDLYILDWQEKRWKRPLYEGQTNVRGHAAATLHDKLLVFGGARDKKDAREVVIEEKISKKLFFLNVLAIKETGVNDGDFKFKLVTVGDSGVGKSCLLTRFVQDFYADFHVSTIGVDFKTVVTMVKGKLVKLQLWDTAGQERFSVVTGNYYRNSDGFIFVYDATNRTSFDHVDQWMEQVQQHHDCGPNTMKILVGNKHDLKDQIQVPESEGMQKASKMGAIFMCTSAKTAANVDMAFLSAATNLVEMRKARAAVTAASAGTSGGGGIGLTAANANSTGTTGSKCNCK